MADSPIRHVTTAEIEHFEEHGWAVLRSLIDPSLAATLHERATQLPRPEPEATGRTAYQGRLWQEFQHPSREHEEFRSVAHSPVMAGNASRLMRGAPDVRLFVDQAMVKEAAGADGPNRPTTFHQDSPFMPFDRSGTLTFWIALVDVPAAMGSMRFYNGSHRFGNLGRATLREGDDLPNQQPWLKELELSHPLDLARGDATVHDFLTVHGGPANALDRPRWSYSTTYSPADILYTGAPHRLTDGLGLVVNERLDHPNFPPVPAA